MSKVLKIFGTSELVASLIKALIDFGKEAIAAPQRVDFGEYAMSFFLMETEKGDYWCAALSDEKDHEKATRETLKTLEKEIKRLIMAMSQETGVVFKSDELTTYIDEKIDAIIRKKRKPLETLRNDTTKSTLLGCPFVFTLIFFWASMLSPFGVAFLVFPPHQPKVSL